MRNSTATSVVLALILFGGASTVPAQDDMFKPIKTLRDTVLQMGDFFKTLIGSVDALAAVENRRRLIEDLSKLNKSLFDLEQDKRFLLRAAERRPVNVILVRQGIEDSENALKDVRQRMRDSGLSLRQQFRLKGREIERSLEELTGSRKNWLEDLDEALKRNKQPNLGPLVKEGNELVDALANANQQLIELIDALRQTP